MRDATHYTASAGAVVPPDQLAAYAAESLATVPLNAAAPTGGDVVEVTANHGRWIVSCPDCGGALLAHPADRRFLCVDCGNAGVGGRYRRVVWPKDHEAIAELLDARADVALRNWSPGESLAQLRAENALLEQRPVILEQPGWQAEKWQGHKHRWPKNGGPCSECGHPRVEGAAGWPGTGGAA